MQGIEQCRLACGGHGYSLASGLPKIYVQTTAACTYEGENTVLFLQTARYLVKIYQQMRSGKEVVEGSVSYLQRSGNERSTLRDPLTVEALLDAYRHRAMRLIGRCVDRLARLQAEGRDWHDAWNMSSVDLVKAAEAHCQVYVCETFAERLTYSSDENVLVVLHQLFQLFTLTGINNSAVDFVEDGYMSTAQLELVRASVLTLLSVIRPNAVALVDAFDFTDHLLQSTLGRYDGNVYENLYKWALNSPLNTTDVHEAVKYLKPIGSKL